MIMRWRVGRKVGRTIYEQVEEEPGDDDRLIGLMDSAELAQLVVDAVNERYKKGPVFRVPIVESRMGGPR